MNKFNEDDKPIKRINLVENIATLVNKQLPIILLVSGFMSLEWTPNLVRGSIIVEVDSVIKPNIFHYLLVFTFFAVVFTCISSVITFGQLEIKRRVSCKYSFFGATIGLVFGIFTGIDKFSSLRFFCGNTTFFSILLYQFIIVLFWATFGFFLGFLIAIFSEKLIYRLAGYFR